MEIGLPTAESVGDRTISTFVCTELPHFAGPEPGGFLPREALKFMQIVAKEGLCGMEVVEISSPYDKSDITDLLGVRAIADVLATLIDAGHLGERVGE